LNIIVHERLGAIHYVSGLHSNVKQMTFFSSDLSYIYSTDKLFYKHGRLLTL